jgi:hypothetical protein
MPTDTVDLVGSPTSADVSSRPQARPPRPPPNRRPARNRRQSDAARHSSTEPRQTPTVNVRFRSDRNIRA